MNSNEDLKVNNNFKKFYPYDDGVAKANTPYFSEAYMDPKKSKRTRIYGLIVLIIFAIIFYSMEETAKTIFVFSFFAVTIFIIIPILYIVQTKRGVVQLAKSDLTVFALNNSDELYLIIAKPEQFGKDLAAVLGVDIATSSTLATNATLYSQSVAEQKRKINLVRYISEPTNIFNILNLGKIKKEFDIYKIDKTLKLNEANTYYKGQFLMLDVIKNKVVKKSFNVGKVYRNYEELINLLNSKRV